MGCLPGVLPGADPFLVSKSDFDPGKGPLFNRAAFENGANGGIFGLDPGHGSRTTSLRQFGFVNHDFVLAKNTKITEKVGFQIRAEAFNLWNSHHFARGTTWGEGQAFITDLGNPNFGLWTGNVSAPRNIQLAARVVF
jgi:hypothetical protein